MPASECGLPDRRRPRARLIPGTVAICPWLSKRKKDNKVHITVDTMGHLLALHVTSANEQERAQVAERAAQVQKVTEQSVTFASVDQGYTGDVAVDEAKAQGIEICVVKLPPSKKGFVLLPCRWVVERSFAWTARFSAACQRLRATA